MELIQDNLFERNTDIFIFEQLLQNATTAAVAGHMMQTLFTQALKIENKRFNAFLKKKNEGSKGQRIIQRCIPVSNAIQFREACSLCGTALGNFHQVLPVSHGTEVSRIFHTFRLVVGYLTLRQDVSRFVLDFLLLPVSSSSELE